MQNNTESGEIINIINFGTHYYCGKVPVRLKKVQSFHFL